jgi:hypothetical protein
MAIMVMMKMLVVMIVEHDDKGDGEDVVFF